MKFLGDHAVIGMSLPRGSKTVSGLALDDHLAREGVAARCGLAMVNLATGDMERRLEIEAMVSEFHDIVALPEVRRPMAVGLKSDESRFMI